MKFKMVMISYFLVSGPAALAINASQEAFLSDQLSGSFVAQCSEREGDPSVQLAIFDQGGNPSHFVLNGKSISQVEVGDNDSTQARIYFGGGFKIVLSSELVKSKTGSAELSELTGHVDGDPVYAQLQVLNCTIR